MVQLLIFHDLLLSHIFEFFFEIFSLICECKKKKNKCQQLWTSKRRRRSRRIRKTSRKKSCRKVKKQKQKEKQKLQDLQEEQKTDEVRDVSSSCHLSRCLSDFILVIFRLNKPSLLVRKKNYVYNLNVIKRAYCFQVSF